MCGWVHAWCDCGSAGCCWCVWLGACMVGVWQCGGGSKQSRKQKRGEGKEEEGEGGEGASQRLLGGAEAPALLVGGADAPAPPNPHASVGAFSIFQLIQNAGSATWYGVSLWLPLHSAPGVVGTFAQVWLQAALLLLVVATFVAVDRLTAQIKKAVNDQIK